MVERVARTARESYCAAHSWEQLAIRVIAAMRKPTDAMCEAAYDPPALDHTGGTNEIQAENAWKKMIDAALKD